MSAWRPEIFDFLDYRKYLQAYYNAAKEHNSVFSYRWFSRKAGYSSPNFLKLVIDGERNISPDSIDRFAAVLGLKASEKRFFADLVAFNQAETDKDRNMAFERVAASRRFKAARKLDHTYFQYLSNWYYPAIREMVARTDFVEDPEWIGRQLVPTVQPALVATALRLLLELGLVERSEDGRLTRGNPSISTGHEVRSLAIGNYHRQMMSRAAESIEAVGRERRDISALTVCIPLDRVSELKDRIQGFREVLLDLCDRSESPEAVYQINFQLFPLSLPDKS
jgi:uncharacterized protein (TIGR02147 family)